MSTQPAYGLVHAQENHWNMSIQTFEVNGITPHNFPSIAFVRAQRQYEDTQALFQWVKDNWELALNLTKTWQAQIRTPLPMCGKATARPGEIDAYKFDGRKAPVEYEGDQYYFFQYSDVYAIINGLFNLMWRWPGALPGEFKKLFMACHYGVGNLGENILRQLGALPGWFNRGAASRLSIYPTDGVGFAPHANIDLISLVFGGPGLKYIRKDEGEKGVLEEVKIPEGCGVVLGGALLLKLLGMEAVNVHTVEGNIAKRISFVGYSLRRHDLPFHARTAGEIAQKAVDSLD